MNIKNYWALSEFVDAFPRILEQVGEMETILIDKNNRTYRVKIKRQKDELIEVKEDKEV